MSLEAIVRGQGVAIIPRIILALYKDADRLTFPLKSSIPSVGRYYVLTRDSQSKNREIHALPNCVIVEARNLQAKA